MAQFVNRSICTGFGGPGAFPDLRNLKLNRPLRVGIIGDSQSAGRVTGTGHYGMYGARALCYGTILANTLRALGIAASSESMSEANNSEEGAIALPLYDPRYVAGTFSVAGGTGIGGRLITKATATGPGQGSFSPSTPVDTFEAWTPILTYGTLNCRIDAEALVAINQNGPAEFRKTTLVSSAGPGMRKINLEKAGGAGAAGVFLNTIIAYNSQVNDIRIVNLSARGWSTTDWLVSDQPWRAFPGLAAMGFDIIIPMLGPNDRRVGGAGNSDTVMAGNLQAVVTQSGAQKVIFALPMPMAQANIATYSDAAQLTVYEDLARTNNAALYRTDLLLGSWEEAQAKGLVSDPLHWPAFASEAIGKGLVRPVLEAALALAA